MLNFRLDNYTVYLSFSISIRSVNLELVQLTLYAEGESGITGNIKPFFFVLDKVIKQCTK